MELRRVLFRSTLARSRLGDRASVQAATRVNAKQASKRSMCRPTRPPNRGRLLRSGEMSEDYAQPLHRGTGGSMHTRKGTQHGKPHCVIRDDQPDARKGQAGRTGVAERPVVPMKPGNAGGGKGPQFKTDARRGEGPGDWAFQAPLLRRVTGDNFVDWRDGIFLGMRG